MRTADKNHISRHVLFLVLVVAVVAGARIATASERVPLEQGIHDNAFHVGCCCRDALIRVVRIVKGGRPPFPRPAAARRAQRRDVSSEPEAWAGERCVCTGSSFG